MAKTQKIQKTQTVRIVEFEPSQVPAVALEDMSVREKDVLVKVEVIQKTCGCMQVIEEYEMQISKGGSISTPRHENWNEIRVSKVRDI